MYRTACQILIGVMSEKFHIEKQDINSLERSKKGKEINQKETESVKPLRIFEFEGMSCLPDITSISSMLVSICFNSRIF